MCAYVHVYMMDKEAKNESAGKNVATTNGVIDSSHAVSARLPQATTLSGDLINRLNEIFSNAASQDVQSSESTELTSTTSRPAETVAANKLCWVKPDQEQLKCLVDYVRKRLETENGEIILAIGQNQGRCVL